MGDRLKPSSQSLVQFLSSERRSSSIAPLRHLLVSHKTIIVPSVVLAALLLLSKMTIRQEATSWLFSASHLETAAVPKPGQKAPSSIQLVLPCGDGRPAVVVFLRHCGCPFAEKTFVQMRAAAESRPDIHFIAVSHSNRQATDKWVEAVGGLGKISLIVDANCTLYAQWGLGTSGWMHVLSPWSMWSVFRLSRNEGIANRPTESGSRWQTAGSFVVNGEGTVTWGNASQRADEIPNFTEAVESL